MLTENLSTFKIHKLTQAQYDRELEAGRIDENALYITHGDNNKLILIDEITGEKYAISIRNGSLVTQKIE